MSDTDTAYEKRRQEYVRKWLADRKAAAARAKTSYEERAGYANEMAGDLEDQMVWVRVWLLTLCSIYGVGAVITTIQTVRYEAPLYMWSLPILFALFSGALCWVAVVMRAR